MILGGASYTIVEREGMDEGRNGRGEMEEKEKNQ